MITRDMFDQLVGDIVIKEYRKISPDADAKAAGESKGVNLEVSYKGLTLGDVFTKAFKTDVVSWQNGGKTGRNNYKNYSEGQVVKVDAKAPAKAPAVDPLTAIISAAQAEGISVEEYMKRELEKRSGQVTKLRKAE